MSSKPEPGAIQTGWVCWHAPAGATEISQITEYRSDTHDWVLDVPKEGVQAMVRYYESHRPQVINSRNFYTESWDDLALIAATSSTYKLGTLNTDLYWEAMARIKELQSRVENNTIEKYVSSKKRSEGVVLFFDDNGSLRIETDWNNSPSTGLMIMYRLWKEGNSTWMERQSREDLYALFREDEVIEKDLHPQLKLGTLTDVSLQDHIGTALIPGAVSG